MLFYGEYEHRVDAQGRISMPVRFRDSFKSGIILSRGYDKCIVAYPTQEWERMAQNIANMPVTQDKNRRLRRMNFSGAFPSDLDRQGRFLLPAPLRQYAQIGEEVVMAGGGSYLEIWDRDLWAQERQIMDQQGWQIAESMEDRG